MRAAKRSPTPSSDEDPVALRAEYQVAVDMIKLLTDIRFRCLVFVAAITAIANALVSNSASGEIRPALGVLGLLLTLGIAVYELRNSQLYEATIHRAKALESRLKMKSSRSTGGTGGLFSERPRYVHKDQSTSDPIMTFWGVKVQHDFGLAFIYGPALGAWTYLALHGLLSLPAPAYACWPTLPAGWISLLSGIGGGVVAIVSISSFVYHDQNRLKKPRTLTMTEHPNIVVMRQVLAAFQSGDGAALARLFAPEVVWRVPGKSALAKDYRGQAEVFGFFGKLMELTDGTFKVTSLEMLANENGGVFVDRITAERSGRALDVRLMLHVTIRNGQIVEGYDHFHHEHIWDEFWA
jgi:ketosteroid isomerase-like protein